VPDELITLEQIRATAELLRPYVLRSPLLQLEADGIWLKAESLQPVGSFKLRGAINSLLLLGPEARRGVVAHSSGNHAIAVAHAGAVLGVPVTVVMPDDAPAVKVERTRALGARIEVVGPASSERAARAAELAARDELPLVEPYDSRAVLCATATIALEVVEDRVGPPPVLYVPVSGGGLAGGVAAGAKLLDPSIRVVAVEPEVAADYVASRAAGARRALPAEQMARTAADGLRVQQVGALPWVHLQAFVDDAVTVSEAAMAAAADRVASQGHLLLEPSGAVPVAAALAGLGADAPPRDRVAIATGANGERPPPT
jgi:threonine dehydratase